MPRRSSTKASGGFAQPPRPPGLTGAARKVAQERSSYLRERETKERSSIWRGLIFVALLVLVFSLARAGAERAFYPGWWRQW